MKIEICKYCHYYSAYYTKGMDCFNNAYFGVCKKHHANKKERDTCDEYKDNGKRNAAQKEFSLTSLLKCCETIRDIKQILEDHYPLDS